MKKQLRKKCSAYVMTDSDMEFVKAIHIYDTVENRVFYMPNFDERNAHTLIGLVSYKSLVAIYDCDVDILFLLPHWDYSITTQSHIRKFCEDYLNIRVCKSDLINNTVCGCDVWFATGYENGTDFIQTH